MRCGTPRRCWSSIQRCIQLTLAMCANGGWRATRIRSMAPTLAEFVKVTLSGAGSFQWVLNRIDLSSQGTFRCGWFQTFVGKIISRGFVVHLDHSGTTSEGSHYMGFCSVQFGVELGSEKANDLQCGPHYPFWRKLTFYDGSTFCAHANEHSGSRLYNLGQTH